VGGKQNEHLKALVRELEVELEAIRNSRGFRIGQALVGLRRGNFRELVRLPKTFIDTARVKPSTPRASSKSDVFGDKAVGGSLWRNYFGTVRGLIDRELAGSTRPERRCVGIAEPQRVMDLSGIVSFSSVTPFDYDLVIQQTAATDFVVDTVFLVARNSPWHGALSNDMILTEHLIRALKYASTHGLRCILLGKRTPSLPLLSQVAPLFHATLSGDHDPSH